MSATALTHLDIGRKWLDDACSRLGQASGSRVLFTHHGLLDNGTVHQLLATAETSSLENRDAIGPRKRMMNVLVEGLENIQHHALETHRDIAFAMLCRQASGYIISLGNAVHTATAALIGHRVGILNEMDDGDLKEHYLKLLSNSARSHQGGAGLGLMTMARKSERPITVRTCKLGPSIALLVLELRVDLSGQSLPSA